MYNHPDLVAMYARDHHEDLRRAAGEARLRRELIREARRQRRKR